MAIENPKASKTKLAYFKLPDTTKKELLATPIIIAVVALILLPILYDWVAAFWGPVMLLITTLALATEYKFYRLAKLDPDLYIISETQFGVFTADMQTIERALKQIEACMQATKDEFIASTLESYETSLRTQAWKLAEQALIMAKMHGLQNSASVDSRFSDSLDDALKFIKQRAKEISSIAVEATNVVMQAEYSKLHLSVPQDVDRLRDLANAFSKLGTEDHRKSIEANVPEPQLYVQATEEPGLNIDEDIVDAELVDPYRRRVRPMY